MVSWEFPPLVVGGLAAHVDGLSRALVAPATRSSCSRCTTPTSPDDYEVDGRARAAGPHRPAVAAARGLHRPDGLGQPPARAAQPTALDGWRPDVVHAHDWLVAWAGDTLHDLYGVPLVATIHATEQGRNGGPPAARPAGRRSTPSSGGSPTRPTG